MATSPRVGRSYANHRLCLLLVILAACRKGGTGIVDSLGSALHEVQVVSYDG